MKRISTILIALSVATLVALFFLIDPRPVEDEPAHVISPGSGVYIVIMVQNEE